MTPYWISAFLDFAPDDAERGVEFWRQVTGYVVSDRRGSHDEFATLVPPSGDDFLRVQRLDDGPGRIHLDLHVTDPRASADAATRIGALELADEGYVVLRSPGGLTFCNVTHPARVPPQPVTWPAGHTSLVDQVCLDIPPRAWDAEVELWTAVTGWPRRASASRAEFANLLRPSGSPLRILLQRLDDDAETVSAHLDLATTDRAAEVERHLALGAEVTSRHEWWTALRDVTGAAYCITTRRPETPVP